MQFIIDTFNSRSTFWFFMSYRSLDITKLAWLKNPDYIILAKSPTHDRAALNVAA
jgi:hypothetical protein